MIKGKGREQVYRGVQVLARGDSIGPSLSQLSEDSDIYYPQETEDEDM